MIEFFNEVGIFPIILLAGTIVAIALIQTVGKCDSFGNVYHR